MIQYERIFMLFLNWLTGYPIAVEIPAAFTQTWFTTKGQVYNNLGVNTTLNQDATDWLVDNCRNHYLVLLKKKTIYFYHKADAIQFRLTF